MIDLKPKKNNQEKKKNKAAAATTTNFPFTMLEIERLKESAEPSSSTPKKFSSLKNKIDRDTSPNNIVNFFQNQHGTRRVGETSRSGLNTRNPEDCRKYPLVERDIRRFQFCRI